jgi:uncharacterized protein YecT (DUF1311 family)
VRCQLACAFALIAVTAAAQPRPKLDGPSQHDMNDQAAARYRIADRELNAVYARLIASASPDGRQRLEKSQRAWIRFRDLDCEARAGSRDGSFFPASINLCLEAVTDERTRTLKAELECGGGHMTCGGVRQ